MRSLNSFGNEFVNMRAFAWCLLVSHCIASGWAALRNRRGKEKKKKFKEKHFNESFYVIFDFVFHLLLASCIPLPPETISSRDIYATLDAENSDNQNNNNNKRNHATAIPVVPSYVLRVKSVSVLRERESEWVSERARFNQLRSVCVCVCVHYAIATALYLSPDHCVTSVTKSFRAVTI